MVFCFVFKVLFVSTARGSDAVESHIPEICFVQGVKEINHKI